MFHVSLIDCVEVVLYLVLTYVLPGECPSLDCCPGRVARCRVCGGWL